MGFSYLPIVDGEKRNLFGLAPGGVYQAIPITRNTGELLPRLFTLTLWNSHNGYSTGRYVFCGTFLTPEFCLAGFGNSPHYGPPCPVELGLSSPPDFPLWVNSGGATICPPSPPPFLFSFAILLWIA